MSMPPTLIPLGLEHAQRRLPTYRLVPDVQLIRRSPFRLKNRKHDVPGISIRVIRTFARTVALVFARSEKSIDEVGKQVDPENKKRMEKASRVKRVIQVESGAISSVRMAPATKTDGISERMSALCSATSVEECWQRKERRLLWRRSKTK